MARTLSYTTTLTNMVTAILSLLDDQTVKEFIDAGFDRIEDLVKASDNKIDDAVVLPMMAKIRLYDVKYKFPLTTIISTVLW